MANSHTIVILIQFWAYDFIVYYSAPVPFIENRILNFWARVVRSSWLVLTITDLFIFLFVCWHLLRFVFWEFIFALRNRHFFIQAIRIVDLRFFFLFERRLQQMIPDLNSISVELIFERAHKFQLISIYWPTTNSIFVLWKVLTMNFARMELSIRQVRNLLFGEITISRD